MAAFVDGELTVAEIATEARISTLEAESVLVSLAERKVVEFVPPGRTRNVLELAVALERSGAFKEAIGLLKEEIARAPNAAPLVNRLAATLVSQREYPEAEALLRRATELDPGSKVYRLNLESVRARRAREPVKPAPAEPIPDRF